MTAAMRPRERATAVGVALRDPWPWHELAELAATAEETGFASVFLPEITGREAFSTLAALAGETTSLGLGTGIATIVARRPIITAMAAATVDERSGGRLTLGLGTGPAGAGSLERLRDYVLTVRSLLDGRTVETRSGERRHLTMPPRRRIPIWLAALGPRAMSLAGEIADGVLLNWCPPERVAVARRLVREAAEGAGRDPDAVEIAVYVRACVGQPEEEATAALRRAVAEYAAIPAYHRQFEAVGVGEESAAAAAAHARADPPAVPDSLVRAVCLIGAPGEASARLDAYRQAGADHPIVYPIPCLDPRSSVLGTIFALAPRPAVEA
jgi:alkanesulfonate monooxygenase SsuD/methylene tetrahydromethanopterin reductase-like flavin-dependent oxidoreductase (luciferase family)